MADMKIRIGYGLGTRTPTDVERLAGLVDGLEARGFDSLWLSERVTGECPDPLLGLTWAAARTKKLKLGTSVIVVPGRNPMLLAKELATADVLSAGRLLPAVGLGVVDPGEQQAFGVERRERAALLDEVLPLLRRFWTEESVDHEGPRYKYEAASVRPFPVQRPIDVWLGGVAPSELKRTGRLGDGWLPSFCTPDDVRTGRPEIERVAAEHGRAIDPEHFGALIAYTEGAIPDLVASLVQRRRPDTDPADVIVAGVGALRSQIERFIEAGASKFVLIPITEPASWDAELDAVADAVLGLQSSGGAATS
jgi:probable F420-dependent oxidoreductase